MGYAEKLKQLFDNITLHAEDLLLLESFQIQYLPDRVPHKEFSALLRNYPYIHRFLILKHPPIEKFINALLKENEEVLDEDLIEQYCDFLVWEIADLIIYNKFPEVFDDKVDFRWTIDEIIERDSISGKIVADVGAGSGMLAFLLAKYAQTVYAIEPIPSFRKFIREKAKTKKINNIYVMDGFLDRIPLPDNSFDCLFTSNAIGWSLEKELPEIERVVKPNGFAIHLFRFRDNKNENTFHKMLTSSEWGYDCIQYQDKSGIKLKYSKTNPQK